jgi:hypothetical protein
VDVRRELPRIGGSLIVDSQRLIEAKRVLFVGVPDLPSFHYREIRAFSRAILRALTDHAPDTRHLALTLHGTAYGLDEGESFRSEVAGIVEAVTEGQYPRALECVTHLEIGSGRAGRLEALLRELLPFGVIPTPGGGSITDLGENAADQLRSAGYDSAGKPRAFVAMPFSEDMADVFFCGIQRAVNDAGLLCERADQTPYTGDVLGRIKERIRDSTLVIAELSRMNPNVYLEVGYAWGCGCPTVLLAREDVELPYNVRSQRLILYGTIQELEAALTKELRGLVNVLPQRGP